MKKIVLLLISVAFVFTSAGPSFAAEKGNKRKGKYTYRKIYKTCMERGGVESKKPVVNPDAHTQAEWTDIFEKKDFARFKCEEEWSALSDQQLLDIYAYMHSSAKDSPTPAKCK